MAKSAVAGKVNIGFNISEDLAGRIDDIAAGRGVNRTVILLEAITEYIERKENPGTLMEQMEQVLLQHPELLDEPLKMLAARSLSSKRKPGQ